MELFDQLTDGHIDFIKNQKVFFVATAVEEGTINLSPKGLDSLRVVENNRILWMNLTGSGNETAAHVQENPRMTIMMNAFEGKPLILRIYGQARVIHHLDEDWQELVDLFPYSEGSRQIFDLNVEKVQTSCGWAVPEYEFKKHRNILDKSNKVAGERGIRRYWKKSNTKSLDGIDTHIVEKNIGKRPFFFKK
tara:strand:+ start:413 stop:988 length:576 start_codon:yes stop_codon:yes gene_type:complete